ncbi:unnamed protein product, partial [marine sediment metagenome]
EELTLIKEKKTKLIVKSGNVVLIGDDDINLISK